MSRKEILLGLSKPIGYYIHDREVMLRFIPQNVTKVLDVGCGEGNFAKKVKDKTCAEVWGAEINEDIGLIASPKIDKLIKGDISVKINELPNKYFDCIIFNDVLEHLTDPYNLLIKIKDKLTDEGVVVCSIPNVLHTSVIKALIVNKNWKYTDSFVLDKTHLRFFTKKSIIDMFRSSGYILIKIQGINPNNSLGCWIFNILTFGYYWESRYLQYACVVKQE